MGCMYAGTYVVKFTMNKKVIKNYKVDQIKILGRYEYLVKSKFNAVEYLIFLNDNI